MIGLDLSDETAIPVRRCARCARRHLGERCLHCDFAPSRVTSVREGLDPEAAVLAVLRDGWASRPQLAALIDDGHALSVALSRLQTEGSILALPGPRYVLALGSGGEA